MKDRDGSRPTIDPTSSRPPASQSPAARPERSLGLHLWLAANAWRRLFVIALKTLGVTPTQFAVLQAIGQLGIEGHPVTQAMVSREVGVGEMTISTASRAIEARGLINRARDPSDLRSKRLELTDGGSRVVLAGLDIIEEVDDRLTRSLGPGLGAFTSAVRFMLESRGIRRVDDAPRIPA